MHFVDDPVALFVDNAGTTVSGRSSRSKMFIELLDRNYDIMTVTMTMKAMAITIPKMTMTTGIT